MRTLRIPADQGIAGWVVMSGQAIAIDDVSQDPRFATDVAKSTGYMPRSILAMPLQTDRRTLGVIELLDRGRGDGNHVQDHGRNAMELLGVFAEQAALAIEGAAVFRDLGRALIESLAQASGDGDVRNELEAYARRAPKPRAELAELAALFHELGQAGPAERGLAVKVLREVLEYLRQPRAE